MKDTNKAVNPSFILGLTLQDVIILYIYSDMDIGMAIFGIYEDSQPE